MELLQRGLGRPNVHLAKEGLTRQIAKEGSTKQIAVMKGSAPHTMEHRGTLTATQRDNDGWGTEIT